jgi:uncharacterized protein
MVSILDVSLLVIEAGYDGDGGVALVEPEIGPDLVLPDTRNLGRELLESLDDLRGRLRARRGLESQQDGMTEHFGMLPVPARRWNRLRSRSLLSMDPATEIVTAYRAAANDRDWDHHLEAAPLHLQIRYLEEALTTNGFAKAVLSLGAELGLPNWYFGAGGVAQTVWNLRHGFQPPAGIRDYDLVYFDPQDLSAETEKQVENEVARRLSEPGVGVRSDGDGFVVCAPYGLADLIGMVARPNKAIATRDVYEQKTSRWAARWPRLRIIPW